jgi:tetratricopeptide (TPR) repeat protein
MIHHEHPSKPALQNNIGASLLLKNSPSAAKERFYASIATNSHLNVGIDRDGAAYACRRMSYTESLSQLIPHDLCPKIDVAVPGLIWFDNKLQREVMKHNLHGHPGHVRGHGSICCNPRNDELETSVPLGLEYFQHPIRVQSNVDARVAAGINLSLVLFRESHPVEEVLGVLQWAVGMGGGSDGFRAQDSDPILRAIAHSNMGVLRFMQEKYKPALNNFDRAASILQSMENNNRDRNNSQHSDSNSNSDGGHGHEHEHEQSSSSAFISTVELPRDYAQLTVMLNFTRTAIQTQDERKAQICDHLCDIASTISYKDFYRIRWLVDLSKKYMSGLLHHHEEHYGRALEDYNAILSVTRKEWGHDHIHVAAILEKKGMVLFETRKYQNAMLSYLASWKIYEHAGDDLEQSRLLYAIGRTLHDREEYSDALSMYQKAIAVRQKMVSELLEENNETKKKPNALSLTTKSMTIDSIQIWCNVCRIHQIMGDLDKALEANEKIVQMASEMVGGGEIASSHTFVRNRMIVLGNLYTEMGRLDDAMEIFTEVARGNSDGEWMITSHARPGMEDIDSNSFAVQAAKRLGKVVGGRLRPHAAAA